MILCMRMTGGLCYLETFKAELSLVILCLTRQEGLLTLKLVLLNNCVCPPLMCTSINKRCCWGRGQPLLPFIHISPLWPCKSNHPQDGNIFISLALVPSSYRKTEYNWLFCSSAASLLDARVYQAQMRVLIRCPKSTICWGQPACRICSKCSRTCSDNVCESKSQGFGLFWR